MRWLMSLFFVLALSVMGCSETSGAGGSAGDGGAGGEGGTGGGKPPEIVAAEEAALEALTEFIEAFNELCEDGGDEAWAATLNYPHVRIDVVNEVRVWETEQERIDFPDADCESILMFTPNWDHSEFSSIEIVQSSPRKVHIALVSGRFDAEGNGIPGWEKWNVLYILSENDGHWGTLGRSSWAPVYFAEAPEAEAAALEALTEYIEAFNELCADGGEAAWAKTLNYPHVHFEADGQVQVWETEQELIDSMSCEAILSLTPDWDHSEFDSIEIVQRGPSKVHITLVATQYDAAGKALGSFETFFIMTYKEEGQWGTQARSSFAPL